MSEALVSTTRLRALRSALGEGDRPVIVTIHDYPDPDAIASALAMQTLAGSWGLASVIAHGGVLGRPENAEMARQLRIGMRTFPSLENMAEYRGAVFLDTQPLAKNQSLPPEVPVLAVIDHHRLSEDSSRRAPGESRTTTRLVYSDVRSTVGASSTLMLGYFQAAGIVPDARLATALFLGIKTDTDGLLRDAHPADVQAYTALLPLADLATAGKIIHPPLEPDFYRFLHLAMERTVIYGGTAFSFCGEVPTPDMLSTASDTLVPLREVDYCLAAGFHLGRLYLSLRTKAHRNDATRVLLHVVGPDGKGGGHGIAAGGFIDVAGSAEACLAAALDRLLRSTGDAGAPGRELIA